MAGSPDHCRYKTTPASQSVPSDAPLQNPTENQLKTCMHAPDQCRSLVTVNLGMEWNMGGKAGGRERAICAGGLGHKMTDH